MKKIKSHEKDKINFNKIKEKEIILDAIHKLGLLYADQGKLAEVEKIYQRALEGYEKALGPQFFDAFVCESLAWLELRQRSWRNRRDFASPQLIAAVNEARLQYPNNGE